MKNKFIALTLMSIWTTLLSGTPLTTSQAIAHFETRALPGNLKIKGDTPETIKQSASLKWDSATEMLEGEIKVNLNDIDTGISLRNRHMKEKYLQIEQFPEAVFKLNPVKVPSDTTEFSLPGQLTIHGKTLAVTARGFRTPEANKLCLNLKATAKMTDFGIEVPQFMGVRVRDEIELAFEYQGAK